MEIYPIIALFHIGICMILSILSFKFSVSILFNRLLLKKIIKFSPIIVIYLCYVFVFSFVSIFYYLYLLCFWRGNTVIYDARILYILGFSNGKILSSNIVVEIFICYDRCLTVIFPMKYNLEKAKYTIFALISIFIIFIFNAWITADLNPFPQNPKTACFFYTCLLSLSTSSFIHIQRIITAGLNIFGCCLLTFLLRTKLKQCNNKNKRITKTLIFIILITLIFEFFPSVNYYIFQLITDQTLVNIIGPYATTLNSLTVTICSKMYTRTLKKIF